MKKIVNQLVNKLIFLPLWLTILIAIPGFVLTALSLVVEEIPAWFAYAAYALGAYALVICIVRLVQGCRWLGAHYEEIPILRRMLEIPVVQDYFSDFDFRHKVGLYFGFLCNIAFIVLKFATGLVTNSRWLMALAGYYLALALIRFPLVRHLREGEDGTNRMAWIRTAISGVFLLMVNIILSIMLSWMVGRNARFEYPGFLIYAMAVYAFAVTGFAIYQVFKFRNHINPVIGTIKTVSLTAAMVSMLALETAMFSQFASPDTLLFQQQMIASTGLVICVIITIMAVRLMFKAWKHLNIDTQSPESKV